MPGLGKAGDRDHVLMGRIGAAHGIRGEVRLFAFTEQPDAIAHYNPFHTSRPGLVLEIDAVRPAKGALVARLKGVSDRNAAEKLNGVELFVPRDRLPPPQDEDDFYQADLIGLQARLVDGTVLGYVIAVPNFGGGDLLEIRDKATGRTEYFPFTRAVVPRIELAAGYLVIDPPEAVIGEASAAADTGE